MSQPPPNASAIRTQLAAVLASNTFKDSARHRRLLQFLVETTLKGEAEALKEFVIAAEVWDRSASFDPRIHSMVRVQVGRLRTRLERYYAQEGAPDNIRFGIPVGSYRVVFDGSAGTGTAEHAPTPVPVATPATERFQLVEMLGRGGMGEVWKARDTRLDRDAAIKFIADSLTHDPAALNLFEREARAAAAISHANICTVYDVGERDGRPFLAMELLQGANLKHRLEAGSISSETLLNWAIQIADGLDAAHAAGIIHRDLKPANLFVTTRDQVKILDFGLAKLRRETLAHAASAEPRGIDDTPHSGAAGTPGYMSPEQMRGEEIDARADLYSFGAVLYEMATGTLPGKSPAPASARNPQVSSELNRIIAKALEEDREVRYQHAADIRADLKRLKRDSDSGRLTLVQTPPARATRWKFVAGAVAVLAAVIAGGIFLYTRSHPKLTVKDTVVLAEFANGTGDPVFDNTLRQGLSAQLDQSPFLNLLSDARINETLKLMTQPKDAKLTASLAREVCQRTGGAATIEGSISRLGSQYVLGLRAVNCKSGDALAEQQVTANGKEQVLKALGDGAAKLRRQLGESLASVEKYDTPQESVTTGSLEALQAYTMGVRAMDTFCTEAIPHFERAISLDPNFAMAYARMGACYDQTGDSTRSGEFARKAYDLRDRVSDRERFYIASHYELITTGNLEAARKTLELWVQNYPRDANAMNSMVRVYMQLGDYQKALPIAREMVQYSSSRYTTLANVNMYLDRYDEAAAALKKAVAHTPKAAATHFYLYQLAFLRGDTAGMRREVATGMAAPGFEATVLDMQASAETYFGHFAHARELWSLSSAASRRDQNDAEAAGCLAEESIIEAWADNIDFARQQALRALALARDRETEQMAGTALAEVGDLKDAARIATDLSKRFPEDTYARIHAAKIQAEIQFHRGETRKALDALLQLTPYDMVGEPFVSAVYERGQMQLALRDGAAAAAEFQKIVNHPGIVRTYGSGPVARLGLGRAYAMMGDTAKARAAYQDFFQVWKDADPDLPLLREAKAEFAGLR